MLKNSHSIVILLILIFSGCVDSISDKKINTQTKEIDSTSKLDKKPYQKTLTMNNISYDVSVIGSGSIQQLIVQPIGFKEVNDKLTFEIDGQLNNAEIADLNEDGFPELLIYTNSSGSGSYGNVFGFSPNKGKSLSQIYFPPIPEKSKANIGYMGHDEFLIIENKLVRKFPIYKQEDNNSNPTGGIRKIQYKLKNGEASKVFVIDKIEDSKN